MGKAKAEAKAKTKAEAKVKVEIKEVLFSQEQIAQRVRELARQITADYRGKELTLICILKGAAIFWADLSRQIELPLVSEFVAISSYGDRTTSSGAVKFDYDLTHSIEGKEVLIIEDIIDTGRTTAYLKENFLTRRPASVRLCALLDKPSRREVEVAIDYIGFRVPDDFVVGYGLDFAQKYRNLPYIATLKLS
ncbi:MAG: hypoxanthine phosphoribosyltransferase [candidate division NC10 bacterium]|nr:hypoxanthine phosphoribosyltransferase [candidate division NC10 bacterium]